MNSQKVCSSLVCIVSLIWFSSGQEQVSTNTHGVQPGPSPYQGTDTPSLAHIWILRREGQHEEVVKEADRVVNDGADPDMLGTALYLKADSLRQLGEYAKSEQLFSEVLDKYPNVGWEDPTVGGRIHVSPLCEVGRILAKEQDRSPFPESSEAYTSLSWNYLNKGRFDPARILATACIRSFEEVANQQEAAYRRRYRSKDPQLSPNPNDNQDILQQYWALFDVGTCHFIIGQAFQREADLLKDDGGQVARMRTLYDEAIQQYNTVIDSYSGAWCFDPHGPWYWSVARGAKDNKNIVTLMQRRITP